MMYVTSVSQNMPDIILKDKQVRKTLLNFVTNTSTGINDIPSNAPELAPMLTHLFQKTYDKGIFLAV